MADVISTRLGDVSFADPTNALTGLGVTRGGIDTLIKARTPASLDLITGGIKESVRLAQLAGQQIEPLRQFGDLEAFNEQQRLLGLRGAGTQQRAIDRIPVSEFDQEAQRRQRETLLRQAAASGDISGATLQQSQQLAGQQALGNVQNRLAQLEPLANIARSTRSTLSQQAEATRAREAQLRLGRGTQLSNIRFGALAPQISSVQQRADLSGLQGIQAAQTQASTANQLAGLAGQFAPQISSGLGSVGINLSGIPNVNLGSQQDLQLASQTFGF